MAEEKDSVKTESSAYQAMAPQWAICRDVSGGTASMRAAGKTYLPQNPGEEDAKYDNRLNRTVLFNAYQKNKRGMVGMVFRKPPTLSEDVPQTILDHTQNVDLAGKGVFDFAVEVFEDGIEPGQSYILVDFQVATDVKTQEDEKKLGLRPYWVHIKAEDIISWRTANIDGAVVLTQIVIREYVTEAAGKFGENQITQYRVYGRDSWEVWRVQVNESTKKEEEVVVDEGIHSLGEIPLIILNFNPTGFMTSNPPLIDLAYENIGHFQVRSDHRNLMHVASVAMLMIKGRTAGNKDKKIIWSSEGVLDVPKDGDASFIEHEGRALEATKDELKDIEERMARLGLSFIAQGDVDIKATKLKQDKGQSDSQLARMAKELARGMTEALEFHAMWLKEKNPGSFAINIDFDSKALTSEQIKVLGDEVARGHLSLETMWEMLIAGEVLPENFDAEVELERIQNAAGLEGEEDNEGGDGDE